MPEVSDTAGQGQEEEEGPPRGAVLVRQVESQVAGVRGRDEDGVKTR